MGIEKTVGIVPHALPVFAGSLRETMASQPGFEHFYNLEYHAALAEFTAIDAPGSHRMLSERVPRRQSSL